MYRLKARFVIFALALLGGVLASPTQGQNRRLNGPLAPLPADEGGARIFESFMSSDGDWMVYRADHDLSGAPRLVAVPSDGSAPALPISPGDVRDFHIPPAGDCVAFRDLSLALYLVAIDGSQSPVLVAQVGVQPSGLGEFTPDGDELVFVSGDGLQVLPLGGGTPRVIGAGGDSFEISADGTGSSTECGISGATGRVKIRP